ncbi:hypothetical protein BH11PAT3_BH11PAT3_0930 [soil metagenome]
MFKSITDKIHIHKNGKLFGFGVSPNDDWKVLSVLFGVLMLSAAIFGIYVFVKIGEGDIFVVEKTVISHATTLNQTLLTETLQFYKDRAIRLDSIKAIEATVPDPSI